MVHSSGIFDLFENIKTVNTTEIGDTIVLYGFTHLQVNFKIDLWFIYTPFTATSS